MTSGQSYYENYGGLNVADYVERFIRNSPTEMARLRAIGALIPEGVGSLLDVGAGHGVFLEEISAMRGLQGIGVEITQAKIDYARSRGVDLRAGDAGSLPFGDRVFDAVTALEVLEHLPCGVYEAAITEMTRVANEWIIVSVPYDESRRFIGCPYCGARVNPDYHFRSFTAKSLRNLLPGFKLVEALPMGNRRQSAIVSLGRRLLGGWPRFLVCPCCGYRDEPPNPSLGGSPDERRHMRWVRSLAAAIPGRRRPIWLVGIFKRTASYE